MEISRMNLVLRCRFLKTFSMKNSEKITFFHSMNYVYMLHLRYYEIDTTFMLKVIPTGPFLSTITARGNRQLRTNRQEFQH